MIVVDASVVLKWIKADEEDRGKATALYLKHIDKQILVPPLLFIEVANALATKSTTDDADITLALAYIFNAKLTVAVVEPEDIIQAAVFSKKYRTTVYDMLYAVIAQKHQTQLVTADENFIRKTNFPFVKSLKSI